MCWSHINLFPSIERNASCIEASKGSVWYGNEKDVLEYAIRFVIYLGSPNNEDR